MARNIISDMEGSVGVGVTRWNCGSAGPRSYLIVGSIVLAIHLVLLYGFAKISLLQYALRGDGSQYMLAAVALIQGRIIGSHFPLYTALIAITSFVIPMDLAALSIPPLFHTLFALVVYRTLVAMKFRYPLLAAFAAILFPPSAILYTSSALSDSIAIFFVALTFYYALQKREKLMLASAFLAGFTHYYGMMLIIPLAYRYWKSNRSKLPLMLVPTVPFMLLTFYQLIVTGNLLYYVSVHFTIYQEVFGTTPISYPFETLIYIATSLKGLERYYWLGYDGLIFIVYGIGAVRSAKTSHKLSAALSAPFYVYCVLSTAWYGLPRIILYAFPSLADFTEIGKGRVLWWVLVVIATIASVGYSIWFLLIRVPATGFTR